MCARASDYAHLQDAAGRTAFYGLDIYNMSGSIAAVLKYLDRVDPHAASVARERYGCLTPWQKEPSTYGRAVLTEGYEKCEQAVIEQCEALLRKQLDYAKNDLESFTDAAQNARLIASAERYYRIMYYGGAESWNLRDTHMFETLIHVLEAHGNGAKAVVWGPAAAALGAAARTLHWSHLPSLERAVQSLRQHVSPATIRRTCVVRRNACRNAPRT